MAKPTNTFPGARKPLRKPGSTKPGAAKPEASKDHSSKPHSSKPHSAKPHSAKSGAPRPGASQAGRATFGNPKSGDAQSRSAKPDAAAKSAPLGAPTGEPMRIAKAMARAGLCSRREAERWIADGRVSVNGKLLKTPACEVGPSDKVIVDGRPLPLAEPVKLWRYHKPRGVVTTHADPQGRPTVFEKMPPEMERVISIGRLDFNTEGLLLLTNDGGLARFMELPATGWVRRYRVRAKGRVTPQDLENLKQGVEVEGVYYGPVEAAVDSVQGANMWLTIAIREGKNREVRKILSHLGLEVNRLIRTSFGPFQLLDLEPGSVEQVKRRVLAEQLGVKMAQDLGLAESPEERKARHTRGKAAAAAKRDEYDE